MDLPAIEEHGIQKQHLKLLIYGPNGVGKSYVGAQMPAPLFLNIENNVHHYQTPKQNILEWGHMDLFLDGLLAGKYDDKSYKTLVIDSVDRLEKLAQPVAMMLSNVQKMTDKYGEAYHSLVSLFEGLRDKFDRVSAEKHMHLVFISHETPNRVYPLGEDPYDKLGCRLHKSIAPLFYDWCNVIGYAHRLVHVTRTQDLGWSKNQVSAETVETPVGSRVLQVEDAAHCIAKNTFNFKTHEQKIPLTASAILKQWERFYESNHN